MKKIFVFATLVLFAFIANAQTLTQKNLTGVIVPQYMGSGTSTRLPIAFNLKVSGLTANTTYRYFANLAVITDTGTINPGAGNPLFLDATYKYTTSASLTNATGYSTFTTNASGEYTGWFGVVYSGNTRFTEGNTVYPTLAIGDTAGTVIARLASDLGITVLAIGTASNATAGSFIRGTSNATAKNIIAMWDNTAGTGRPLAITPIQGFGVTIASLLPSYASSVVDSAGSYGTIIPNVLPNGVKLIREYARTDASVLNIAMSNTGIWGTTTTVNPTNGPAALFVTSLAAPLPVELTSFVAAVNGTTVSLNWATATELNNKGFEVERKSNGSDFTTVGFVAGKGTTTDVNEYSFADQVAAGSYTYRLRQVDFDGSFEYSNEINVDVTGVNSFELAQNYPNPFNPSTKISFSLANDSKVKLTVFNTLGEEVAVLVNSTLTAGNHSVDFNATNLTSGMYLYKIQAGSFTATKKMVLAK